jgi:hypothetical protein
MEIINIHSEEYARLFISPIHIFNSSDFVSLNISKCEKLHFLIFKDTKIRLGLILGQSSFSARSPFSAPFGGFDFISDDIKLHQIDSALATLDNWAITNSIKSIKVTLPPPIYNSNFYSKLYNCLFRSKYIQNNLEVNYHFETRNISNDYESKIWYNAKKNLKKSLTYDLTFEKLKINEGNKAYDVIAENRNERGFPLRMSWQQILDTMKVIDVDFFIVYSATIPIAAAIVFHVANDIVQVIYWGDLPKFANYKTMNFLSYNIFKYYYSIGISIVDIGPSTENSIPNHGLCEFKESILCDLTIKAEFLKYFY